ncbi:MAG: acyltransferase [Acetobacteraceae bacterium]|nr:acyltransferase [Acetobacteraceae bacterium]
MTAHPASASRRIDTIDGLRAIACLLVFYTHGSELIDFMPGGSHRIVEIAHSVDLGRMGVVLFFAISGFVIPVTLKREPGRDMRAFVINRFCRLFPAFWLSIIPSALMAYWIQGKPFGLGALALNFTMLPRLFGAMPANGGYWTLEVELAFYALCVVLYIGLSERSAFVYTGVGFLAFLIFDSSQAVAVQKHFSLDFPGELYFFFLHISFMMWGTVVRFWWNGERVDPISKLAVIAYACKWLAVEPWRLGAAYATDNFFDTDQRLIVAYGGGMALFLFGLFVVPLTSSVLTWIGRRSYSVYLFHATATLVVIRVVWFVLPRLGDATYPLAAIASIALVMAVSHVVYEWVELPAIQFGHRIARGRAARVLKDAPVGRTQVGGVRVPERYATVAVVERTGSVE